jgi:Domain of unknown function (DUF4167)
MQPNRSEPPGGSNYKINIKTMKQPRQKTPREQSARLNYERYLTRAQAEARSGNLVEAENCYQHAEHYFRAINNHAG